MKLDAENYGAEKGRCPTSHPIRPRCVANLFVSYKFIYHVDCRLTVLLVQFVMVMNNDDCKTPYIYYI